MPVRFIAIVFILTQTSAAFPVLGPDEAYANDKIAAKETKSIEETYLAKIDTNAIIGSQKKAELSETKKKLGTNLLKLIDSNYLLPNESRAEIISRMKKLKQYFGKTDDVGAHSKRRTKEAHNNLVKVYISFEDSVSTNIIDPFVWEVTGRSEEYHLAVALVDTDRLEDIAALKGVKSIKEVTPPRVNRGIVTAESDAALRAAEIRSAYNQQGAGVKIGVISDGVDSISEAKSTGDLPSTIHVLDNSFGGDEGTAMLEIIYDIAPEASLYFHEGGSDLLEFNHAYDDLIAAGCKIIVDDLGWDNEPFFEDGIVGNHLKSLLSSKDIVLVSAAGNEADRHFQGNFYDDGTGSHDFSRGTSSSKRLYATLAPGDWIYIVLQWNDTFGSSSNDYDLSLYNRSNGNKLAESADTQNGNDDPYEWIDYTNNTSSTLSVEIRVEKYSSSSIKTLELYAWTKGDTLLPTNLSAADSVYGHPNVKGMLAVGAIDSRDTGWDTIESYSSRGPTTYNTETRNKPDLVGIDNISVSGAGDFGSRFSGTSAAAPGIAAVIAQLWGAFPELSGNDIRNALLASAVDLGAAGYDHTYGYGRADAVRAYNYLVKATQKSSEKAIVSFSIKGVSGTIKESDHTIKVTLPAGTSVTSLTPTIAVSQYATVSPASGTARNFSSPVTYTVTAEDGSKQTYTVTVEVERQLSSEKDIISFIVKGNAGVINKTTKTITVNLPSGTSVTSLSPDIYISPYATVSPASGTARNFSSPVTYTVTAEDGSKQTYTAQVVITNETVPLSSAKSITNFILGGVTGVINESASTITVNLPAGTSVTSLSPDIYISPYATVSPASGDSRDFSRPVTYTVTAEDGSVRSYTVTAIVAAANNGYPTGTVTYDITAPTNSNVIATLHPSEPVTITSEGGKYHTFTENGSWTFTYKDADGNPGSTVAKVTNIDKTAPTIILQGNKTITLAVGNSYNEEGATARDNMDNSVVVIATGAVNGNVPGTYTIKYTATDDAGNTATATRTITVSGDAPANTDSASIKSFILASFNPDVIGIIDDTAHKILLTVPYGTNVTALVPTILVADGATVNPASGVAQNFSVSRTYTVTSANGIKQSYVVTVKIDASKEDTVTATNSKITITSKQKGVLIQNLSNDNKVQAEIPKGSVTSETDFTIKQEILSANDTPDIAGAQLFSELAFNIEAVDKNNVYIESLEESMTVTITVPTLPKSTAGLKVFYYDEARKNWAQVSGVNFGANTITFIADYLATFAVFRTQLALPANIVDGDIIQCKSSSNPFAVYIVKIVGKNAYIRHIVSLEIFNYYKHLKWENLKQVGSLDPFSLSGWVRVNTGANGQPRSNDKVWEINGDQTKHWINMTASQFLAHGGSDEAIYSINQGELNLYRTGPDVMSL